MSGPKIRGAYKACLIFFNPCPNCYIVALIKLGGLALSVLALPFPLTAFSNFNKMINNKNLGAAINDDNEQSDKVSWWINELESLAIEKSSSNKNELKIFKSLRILLMV